MTCIPELHVTRLEVDESDEHGNEHTLLVVFGEHAVQSVGNGVRRELAVNQRAEHSRHFRHIESCGHSLAADVAHAEVEQVVDERVAVEVAAHLAGRGHHGIDIDILALGEYVRQHTLLYLTGNAQLALNALLRLRSLLKHVVGILQLLVDHLQALHLLPVTIGKDGEEGDDECSDNATRPNHHAVFCQFLLLHLVLGVGDGELGIKLVHLRTGLRRLDGVYHRTGALLPVERLLQVTHVFIDGGFLRTFVLLVNQLLGALQGQLPLLAVLGLIDVDELSEESALATVLGYELGTLPVSLLEPQAVALVIARQALVAPGRYLVHGNDARLFEGLAGILLHLFVVLPVECSFTKSQVAGSRTLVKPVFLLQLQCLKEALFGQSHVARLLADGTQREGGEVHADVAVFLFGLMVDVVSQLHALLTVHVLEHIDGLVAANPVVGLLVLG